MRSSKVHVDVEDDLNGVHESIKLALHVDCHARDALAGTRSTHSLRILNEDRYTLWPKL